MFAVQPFSTVGFSDGEMFLDALTTTNVVTSAITGVVPESRIITTTAGLVTSAVQTLPANSITVAIPEASTVLSGTLTFTIPGASIFTYNDVSDSIGESWSDVVTTGTSETWNDV